VADFHVGKEVPATQIRMETGILRSDLFDKRQEKVKGTGNYKACGVQSQLTELAEDPFVPGVIICCVRMKSVMGKSPMCAFPCQRKLKNLR
jgi:hypothetical protein